jgi:hypothetical protein
VRICARGTERRASCGAPGIETEERSEVEGYEGEYGVARRANDGLAKPLLDLLWVEEVRAKTYFGASIIVELLELLQGRDMSDCP